MTPIMSHVIAFMRCVAVWFVVVLPFAPSVLGVYLSWSYCFSTSHADPVGCFAFVTYLAPIAFVFGPLSGIVSEPINRWPDVLATALILAVFATTMSFACRKLMAYRPG